MAMTLGSSISAVFAGHGLGLGLVFLTLAAACGNVDSKGSDAGLGEDSGVVGSPLCLAVCEQSLGRKCWAGSMSSCVSDCEARTACDAWRWYLECALTKSGDLGCGDDTLFNSSCGMEASELYTCPPISTACTPGTARDCKCVPPGWGITYCEENGRYGPCFNCQR